LSDKKSALQKVPHQAKAALEKAFNSAIKSQDSIAVENIARLRRVHPEKTPQELTQYLNKWYLGVVTTTGAAAGATAAVPNIAIQGTAAIAELALFLEASVLYVLSIAEINGLHTEDLERRKLLVASAFVGESIAKGFIEKGVGPVSQHLGKLIVSKIPRESIKAINKVLGPRFITITGTKTGTLVLTKQIPLFVGAALGAAGNHVFARMTVIATRKIVGPAPESWSNLRIPELPSDSSPKNDGK
jgi:hypothetical protein